MAAPKAWSSFFFAKNDLSGLMPRFNGCPAFLNSIEQIKKFPGVLPKTPKCSFHLFC
jgi:hypothetical protein